MARKKRDPEIAALFKVERSFADLDEGARDRVVAWLADRYMGVHLWDRCRPSPKPVQPAVDDER